MNRTAAGFTSSAATEYEEAKRVGSALA